MYIKLFNVTEGITVTAKKCRVEFSIKSWFRWLVINVSSACVRNLCHFCCLLPRWVWRPRQQLEMWQWLFCTLLKKNLPNFELFINLVERQLMPPERFRKFSELINPTPSLINSEICEISWGSVDYTYSLFSQLLYIKARDATTFCAEVTHIL